MAKKNFSREFLKDTLGLPRGSNVLRDTIVDTGRRNEIHELVFKNPKDGKTYMCSYSVGSTEMQDESPWEYDRAVECEEVELVKQIEEVYLPKDRPRDFLGELLEVSKFVSQFSKEVDDAHLCTEERKVVGTPILVELFCAYNVEEVLYSYDTKEIEYIVARNKERRILHNWKVNHDGWKVNLDGFSEGIDFKEVPLKFIGKFLEKANKYFDDNKIPYNAFYTGTSVSVTPKEGMGIHNPPALFEPAPFFAFYKEQKQAGEKKPMLRTVKHAVSFLKDNVVCGASLNGKDELGRHAKGPDEDEEIPFF